jgi:hypothetical protein
MTAVYVLMPIGLNFIHSMVTRGVILTAVVLSINLMEREIVSLIKYTCLSTETTMLASSSDGHISFEQLDCACKLFEPIRMSMKRI